MLSFPDLHLQRFLLLSEVKEEKKIIDQINVTNNDNLLNLTVINL